jgi:pilus assembly protein CpaF
MTKYKESHMNPLDQINLQPIDSLISDPEVTEVMINGLEHVYVEKRGKLQETNVKFETEEQLLGLIQNLVQGLGREVNEMNPMVDVRLPDGSRFNVVLPPIAINGPSVTIRKTMRQAISWDDLISFRALSPKTRDLLRAIMQAGLNVVVAGGTSSGKTTILNALTEFIPHDERIVTVERIAELQVRHPHVISLETRPPNSEGQGEVTMRDLIINATMMRADRLLMAEVRGGEVWDMLQAMSGGHDGSAFGMHATSVQDVLERIEMMATAATNLPLLQIRAKMAQSIQVIVQQLRLNEGSRKIVTIAEVTGLKNNLIETRDIVRFEESGMKDGKVMGEFQFTGYVPSFASRLNLSEDFFRQS